MEQKLIIGLSILCLVLVVSLAMSLGLFAGPSLLGTALAQTGGEGSGWGGCLRSGLTVGQMPCASRSASTSGAEPGTAVPGFKPTGNVVKDAESAALAYYRQKYGDGTVTAKATDYGCHVQADVYKDGKLVKSFGYDRAGGIYEFR